MHSKTFEDLLNDDFNGATTIFRSTINLFLSYDEIDQIKTEAYRLVNHFPAMGLFHTMNREISRANSIGELQEILKGLLNQLDKNFDRVIAKASSELFYSCSIITISHSSFVRQLILNCREKIKFVHCLRSGPKNEGEELCGILKIEGINAGIVNDQDYEIALRSSDLVICGSDMVGPEYFINKAGTRSLCESAHRSGKISFILGDALRYLPNEEIMDLPDTFEVVPMMESYKVFT